MPLREVSLPIYPPYPLAAPAARITHLPPPTCMSVTSVIPGCDAEATGERAVEVGLRHARVQRRRRRHVESRRRGLAADDEAAMMKMRSGSPLVSGGGVGGQGASGRYPITLARYPAADSHLALPIYPPSPEAAADASITPLPPALTSHPRYISRKRTKRCVKY